MASENHRPRSYTTKSELDFDVLSLTDREFAALLQSNNGRFDFRNPEHHKQLTKSILKKDFDLKLELPDDRLCPPVPVRYNYVCWIQDLIQSTNPSYDSHDDAAREVHGLDIGVGASNIYSLLILRMIPSWRMHGTDIDETNYSSALANTELNSFGDRMQLLKNATEKPLIPLDRLSTDRLDFTICNPPFFTDASEMEASLSGEGKSMEPAAACTGAEVEMVTEGGDIGFVSRMLEESIQLRDKVQWYSSMLGKLSSLKTIVDRLKEIGVTNWAVCALTAGAKTQRWAVAWSFNDLRPDNDVARRFLTKNLNHLLPFPTVHTISFPKNVFTQASPKITAYRSRVEDQIVSYLKSLELGWTWDSEHQTGIGIAPQNVWSRAYRQQQKEKKRKRDMEDPEQPSKDTGISEPEQSTSMAKEHSPALVFRMLLLTDKVEIHWVRGIDTVLWESFCGAMDRLTREVKVE